MPRNFAGLGALSALGRQTIAGTIYPVGGQGTAALYAMERYAGIGIVAAVLMIVFGGLSGGSAIPWLPSREGCAE